MFNNGRGQSPSKGLNPMLDGKWFLASSTVLGALSLAAMVVGPLVGLTDVQVDSIVGALLTLTVVAGRDNAERRLTLTPEALRRAADGVVRWLAALRERAS